LGSIVATPILPVTTVSKNPFIKGNHVVLQSLRIIQRETSEVKVKPYAKVSMVHKWHPFANGPNIKKKRKRNKRTEQRNV